MAELTSRKQLEARFGAPPGIVLAKTIHQLDAGAMSWLAASTLMIASVANGDDLDILLGGGAAGWAGGDNARLRLPVDALDPPQRLAPGSAFGSIFMVPSLNELMRVNGRVIASEDSEVWVAVEECYIHCGKALIRSDFWSHAPDRPGRHAPEHFAEQCRFMGLATCDPHSHADLSPKGDPAGLMVQLDHAVLRFADRPGNRRTDSFRNIIDQPRVAAVMVIPGSFQLMIVKGTARITDDLAEREKFSVNNKVPELVTLVTDISIDRRESQALARAKAWPAASAPAGLNAGKVAAGHLKLGKGVGAKLAGLAMSVPGLVEREMAKDYKKNLY